MRMGNRILLGACLATLGVSGLALLPMKRVAAQSVQRVALGREPGAAREDDRAATEAFEAMVPVLRNPRCMNCHSKGDFPRQGDDSHRHTMQVRRGPEGHGVSPVTCSTCHQDHNLAGRDMPPGAPGWELPYPGMPMIWEGLSDRELCELLKDPVRNGHRTAEQIVEHMHTPLVLWGWAPGDGRSAIPVAQDKFLASVQEWAAKGAACPSSAGAVATERR
jgi:hypothetical protein